LDLGLHGCNPPVIVGGTTGIGFADAENAGWLSGQYDVRAIDVGLDRAIGRAADMLSPLRGFAVRLAR